MSTDRDVTRIVRSWLEEGATALPDRVLDVVLDQVPATPQRRPWWPAWRFADMNNTPSSRSRPPPWWWSPSSASTCCRRVRRGRRFPRTPIPTLTPAARPRHRPGGRHRALARRELPLRRDSGDLEGVPFTFTVPAGWTGREDGFVYHKNGDQANESGLWTTVVTHVYTDACAAERTLAKVGPTVDDLVQALEDQGGSERSTPVDVTLGGIWPRSASMSRSRLTWKSALMMGN